MAKQKTNDKHDGEFEYQRFLDTVKGAPELCAVNDRFAREVFAYTQNNDYFTAQEFVELLAELINIAAYPSTADRLMSENKERFPNHKGDGTEAAHSIARQFGGAQPSDLAVEPEEKKLAELTFEQKFDLIHFALCALNLLSNENSFCLPSIEYLTKKRGDFVRLATRDGENSADYIRAEKVKKRDIVIENRWKTGDLSLNEFTIRQKVLSLLLLIFGKMEVPKGVNKTHVIDFIYSITGNDRQKIKELIYSNPTKTKDGERSIQLLCADIYFVRDRLSQFRMIEAVESADNEIDFLLAELEEKSE